MPAIYLSSPRVKTLKQWRAGFKTVGARRHLKKQETENKARVWVFRKAGEPGLSFVSNLVQKIPFHVCCSLLQEL